MDVRDRHRLVCCYQSLPNASPLRSRQQPGCLNSAVSPCHWKIVIPRIFTASLLVYSTVSPPAALMVQTAEGRRAWPNRKPWGSCFVWLWSLLCYVHIRPALVYLITFSRRWTKTNWTCWGEKNTADWTSRLEPSHAQPNWWRSKVGDIIAVWFNISD